MSNELAAQLHEDAATVRTALDYSDKEWVSARLLEAASKIETLEAEVASLRSENARLEEELGIEKELVWSIGGREVQYAVEKQWDAVKRAMKKGNAPDALQNLASACALLAAHCIVYARWAVAGHKATEAAESKLRRLERIEAAAKEPCWHCHADPTKNPALAAALEEEAPQ